MENIVILGAGQQGRNCKRLAIENGYGVRAFVDDYVDGEVEGVKVYKKIEDIPDYEGFKYIIAFGEIEPRRKYAAHMKRLNLKGVNLIDKTACIEDGAKIGTGNYICKLAIVYASATIGDNNIINCKAVIATDAEIGNNCNISMGANICGGVNVGDESYIGCQASVVSGYNIGKNVTVGAGSVVLSDVPDGEFVAGAPATRVVRKSQKEDYLKVIPEENLIAVDDEEICSVSKVWNWVIDNAEEEVIAILGDDMSGCLYRLDFNVPIEDYSLITAEIERIAQLIYDLDIGYGCDDATNTPWNYNQEFAFTGTTGGITWVNRKVYKSRYNDAIGYCCDFDVVFQELLKNRIVLKPKYFCPVAGTDTNKGGNSSKTRQSMIDSFKTMKLKWGKYFDYDLKSNKVFCRVKR